MKPISHRNGRIVENRRSPAFAADMRSDNAVERAALPAQVPVDVGLAIDASGARTRFATSGAGACVAIVDSGLNYGHEDFRGGRPMRCIDFCAGDAGGLAVDESGHGSHLAGIVAGAGSHVGIAPGADLLSLRVLSGPRASGDMAVVKRALDWLLDCPDSRGVDVVLLAVADGGCYLPGEVSPAEDPLGAAIDALTGRRIPVVAPAGNRFARLDHKQGMAYPAARLNVVSVAGCVRQNADWVLTGASQRSPGTTLAAPSGPYASASSVGNSGTSVREGTSQASAAVAGALALLQRRHLDIMGARASVDRLQQWLQTGARGHIGELPVLNVEGALQALEQARGKRLGR